MAAYRRVYDSRHLQADAKNRDRLRNRTLGNRVRATVTFQSRLLPRSATGSVADAGEKATRLPVATATAAAAGSTLPGGRRHHRRDQYTGRRGRH